MDKKLSTRTTRKIRRRRRSHPKKITSKICSIIKDHSEKLKSDPDRLKSNFLLQIILDHDILLNELIVLISTDMIDLLKNEELIEQFFLMDPIIQKKIIEHCGRIKNETAIRFLGKCLSLKSEENLMMVSNILLEIGNEKSLEQLMLGYHIKALHSTINSVIKQRGQEGIEFLKKFSESKNPVIRFNSMIALGEMGELAMDSLYQFLLDEKVVLRRIAANALGDIGNMQTLQALSLALNDPDEEVRKRAIESCSIITQNILDQIAQPYIEREEINKKTVLSTEMT